MMLYVPIENGTGLELELYTFYRPKSKNPNTPKLHYYQEEKLLQITFNIHSRGEEEIINHKRLKSLTELFGKKFKIEGELYFKYFNGTELGSLSSFQMKDDKGIPIDCELLNMDKGPQSLQFFYEGIFLESIEK